MIKRFSLKIDLIAAKNTAFVYITKKRSTKLSEKDIRERLLEQGNTFGSLKKFNEKVYVFNIEDKEESFREKAIRNFKSEDLKMTDLTLSYGSSELEKAPEIEDKPKTTRRRRTRKKVTKTTESGE